jgi:hypothetical protein
LRFAPNIHLRIGESVLSPFNSISAATGTTLTAEVHEPQEEPPNRLRRATTKEELIKEIEDNTTPIATPTATPPLTPINNSRKSFITQSLVSLKEVEPNDRMTQSESNVVQYVFTTIKSKLLGRKRLLKILSSA